MDSSSTDALGSHSDLEGRHLLAWPVLDLGGIGISNRVIRPQAADLPHDEALASHDVRSTVCLAGRARKGLPKRTAAGCRDGFSQGSAKTHRIRPDTNSYEACGVLDRLRGNLAFLAFAASVRACYALGNLAHD